MRATVHQGFIAHHLPWIVSVHGTASTGDAVWHLSGTTVTWLEDAGLDIISHLSHLSPPSPCAGQRVLHRLFHLSRSVAHSSMILHAFMSLLTVSFHLNFGLPLGRFPSIFISTTALMFSVSSLLLTWPNHSSLLLLITVAICSTFASSKISSFLRCSNRLTPIAHRTIVISVVAIRLSSVTDIGHVSQPYRSIGRITVWCIRIFSFIGTFLSQITPLSSLHFDHAFATLFSTSLLAPPLLSIVDPRYLNDWTVG